MLSGRSPGQLGRRAETLLELCRRDPHVERLAGRVTISVTSLSELIEHGPFAPIFSSPFDDGPSDVVGVEGLALVELAADPLAQLGLLQVAQDEQDLDQLPSPNSRSP